MLATDGYFTFLASRPQLACAAFIIAEPNEVISLELSDVNIDCSAGDFIKVGPPLTKNNTHTCLWRERRTGSLVLCHLNSEFYFILLCLIKLVPNRVKAVFKGQTPHWILSALVTLPRASVGRGGFGFEAKPASYIAVSLCVGPTGKKGMAGRKTGNPVTS